ncbi:hydantoinase B/oxoprolinase family protein [Planctomycetota bacterium]
MPPFSRSLEEEGVSFHGLRVVSSGVFAEEEVRRTLASGPYPARDLRERLSDLRASVAANQTGVRLLSELVDRYGLTVVHAYMGHVRQNAEEATRAVISELPDGRHTFFDHLDEGARIAVAIEIDGDRAVVDFQGTSPQVAGNLNAPRAVVTAAVLYAFRTLVSRAIPLNSGCLAPIEIRVPQGSLLDPQAPAAVCGGNVETSMRIADVIFGALCKVAASQGTMNNLTFGNDRFSYYETICGGAGAGPGFTGASAVHTHMTNTRITDPEVLELRYPVRVRAFSIRRGSGGAGDWRGGDGVRRELELLEPMRLSILSERRSVSPFGLFGGGPGRRGRNALVRGGRTYELPGKVELDIEPGDVIVIETPGGGGCNNS